MEQALTVTDEQRNEVIRQAHASGLENNKFHLECADILRAESNTTLGIVAGAAVAAAGYAAKEIESNPSSTSAWGCAGLSVHLLVVCLYIVTKCLRSGPVLPGPNEPRKLFHEGTIWPRILEGDIINLQASIEYNVARNATIGSWLNRLRFWAFLSVVTWGAGSLLAAVLV